MDWYDRLKLGCWVRLVQRMTDNPRVRLVNHSLMYRCYSYYWAPWTSNWVPLCCSTSILAQSFLDTGRSFISPQAKSFSGVRNGGSFTWAGKNKEGINAFRFPVRGARDKGSRRDGWRCQPETHIRSVLHKIWTRCCWHSYRGDTVIRVWRFRTVRQMSRRSTLRVQPPRIGVVTGRRSNALCIKSGRSGLGIFFFFPLFSIVAYQM